MDLLDGSTKVFVTKAHKQQCLIDEEIVSNEVEIILIGKIEDEQRKIFEYRKNWYNFYID